MTEGPWIHPTIRKPKSVFTSNTDPNLPIEEWDWWYEQCDCAAGGCVLPKDAPPYCDACKLPCLQWLGPVEIPEGYTITTYKFELKDAE